MDEQSQIIIGILVLLVLGLAYYAWTNRCVVAQIEGELGREVADLEKEMAEIDTELVSEHLHEKPDPAVRKRPEEEVNRNMSRRDRIEARVRRIQALHKSGDIKLSHRAIVRLRTIVARANDYLVSSSVGENKDAAKMIRRLRDAILAVALQGRQPFCAMATRGAERDAQMLQKLSALSKDELNTKITDEMMLEVSTPVIEKPREYLAKGGNAADAEKYMLIIAYHELNNAICSDEVKRQHRANRSLLEQNLANPRNQGIPATKDQLLELADAFEPLMLDVQKKLCPDGKLDNKKIYKVYQNLMYLWCTDDEFIRKLISQPLDLVLNKHYSLFV